MKRERREGSGKNGPWCKNKTKKISALSLSGPGSKKGKERRERNSANPSSRFYPPRTRIPKVLGVVAVPAVVLIPPKVPLPALSSFPVFSLSFCCRHTAAAALNWKGGICLHDVTVRAANGKEAGLICIKPADWQANVRWAAASVLHERTGLRQC